MTGEAPEEAAPEGFALAEFRDGFSAGYRGERRETNRSATYRNAHAKGVAERKRSDEFAAGPRVA